MEVQFLTMLFDVGHNPKRMSLEGFDQALWWRMPWLMFTRGIPLGFDGVDMGGTTADQRHSRQGT